MIFLFQNQFILNTWKNIEQKVSIINLYNVNVMGLLTEAGDTEGTVGVVISLLTSGESKDTVHN